MSWDDILRILAKATRFSLTESSRRTQPLKSRKARLKKLVQKLPNVIYVDHIEEHGTEFFKLALERGLEGIVAKDKQSPYVSGAETWHWQKIKNRDFERKDPVEFRLARRRF